MPSNNLIKKVSWDEIIIDKKLKDEIQSVVELLKNPKNAHKYGIEPPKGILLSGPPGNGKTMVAKVIANTANLNFFHLDSSEIVSKWVGDSEKNLSALFNAAKRHKPSVIFIDEIDSIGRQRSGNSGQPWAENLLNHLLQQMDGVVSSEGLYVIGATNRDDLVDDALKRAGRLNRVIRVDPPGSDARIDLFYLYLSKLNLGEDIDVNILARITEGCSGADIKEICNQAGLNAFKREGHLKNKSYTVNRDDLQLALQKFAKKQ
ncbi:UNVERIFIED_CONTAM: hypothetical protein GTU68_039688 [Idotea baltica]|nr:hypothetical protein [Idotea baltica]